MTDFAIDIQHVVKRYEEHVAVNDFSLQVPRGTVYGLLGPNGAGKTTTIRMLLDILEPDEGSITILGAAVRGSSVLDRVGYLPEERGLYKKMQVRRVLRFLAELKGLDAKTADRRIDEWLERLELRTAEKDWGTAKVDELSRGMQQKVQFIAALLHDPDIVILDEPFAGLDPINAQALKDTVVHLRDSHKTVIFSTHMMDSAERICDSVCIIARGRKVLDGRVADVKAEHGVRNVALALDGGSRDAVQAVLADRALVAKVDDQNQYFEIKLAEGADAQDLLHRVLQGGARLSRFELIQPSLQQIFIDRVGGNGARPEVAAHA